MGIAAVSTKIEGTAEEISREEIWLPEAGYRLMFGDPPFGPRLWSSGRELRRRRHPRVREKLRAQRNRGNFPEEKNSPGGWLPLDGSGFPIGEWVMELRSGFGGAIRGSANRPESPRKGLGPL